MSIRHDSPAWFRRIRDEGGPVAQGRAVPLREKGLVYERCPCAGFMAVYADGDAPNGMMDAKCGCGDWSYRYPAPYPAQEAAGASQTLGGTSTTDQPPQAAVAPPAAPETGVYNHPGPDPIVAKVCALLLSRSAVGIAKYGTTLAANPLTRKQWAQHALEEALDMALYLQRMIEMEDGE